MPQSLLFKPSRMAIRKTTVCRVWEWKKTQFGPWIRGTEEAAGDSESALDVASKFFNEDRSVARVSAQMMDIGTLEMRELMDEIRPSFRQHFSSASIQLGCDRNQRHLLGRHHIHGEKFGAFQLP